MHYKRVSEYQLTDSVEGKMVLRKYFLVKSQVKVFNGSEDIEVPSYGIEISEEIFLNEMLIRKLVDRVLHVSPYMEKVEELLRYFKDMRVSPLHLCDIIDDNYYKYVDDYDEYIKICKIAI
ncbi:MAG: DUF6514 family protein [Thermoanaerobacteraceae bacterium]|nr:DUF6514 family protein [Thermoanaerobacteraceae bacterium]